MTVDARPSESRGGWNLGSRLRWFAAEFLVVVTGVLVALALGAFVQQRQNANSEDVYLSLLNRDVSSTVRDLEEIVAFERAQLSDGLAAYRAISAPLNAERQKTASVGLQRLLVRRTLRLKDGTYQDLISTGNLRLLRNRALRDSIVDFYEGTARTFEILNKNNSYFVDEMYNSTMLGLITARTSMTNVRGFAPMDSELLDSLTPGYVDEPDRLWSLPMDGREWSQVKTALVNRLRVSAIALRFLNTLLKDTRALNAAIAAEIAGRQ